WVTPDGELLDERGVLHGGRSGEDSGLVARRAELDELERRVVALRAELDELTGRRRQHEGELAVADEQLAQAERDARRLEGERERTAEREQLAAARRSALEHELEARRAELGTLAAERERLEQD